MRSPIIQKIVDYMEDILEKEGISKADLENNGEITYANGGGTAFNWEMGRLPRLGYGSLDGERWVVELTIQKNGTVNASVNQDDGYRHTNSYEDKLLSSEETEELKNLFLKLTDRKQLINVSLHELGLEYDENDMEQDIDL